MEVGEETIGYTVLVTFVCCREITVTYFTRSVNIPHCRCCSRLNAARLISDYAWHCVQLSFARRENKSPVRISPFRIRVTAWIFKSR